MKYRGFGPEFGLGVGLGPVYWTGIDLDGPDPEAGGGGGEAAASEATSASLEPSSSVSATETTSTTPEVIANGAGDAERMGRFLASGEIDDLKESAWFRAMPESDRGLIVEAISAKYSALHRNVDQRVVDAEARGREAATVDITQREQALQQRSDSMSAQLEEIRAVEQSVQRALARGEDPNENLASQLLELQKYKKDTEAKLSEFDVALKKEQESGLNLKKERDGLETRAAEAETALNTRLEAEYERDYGLLRDFLQEQAPHILQDRAAFESALRYANDFDNPEQYVTVLNIRHPPPANGKAPAKPEAPPAAIKNASVRSSSAAPTAKAPRRRRFQSTHQVLRSYRNN